MTPQLQDESLAEAHDFSVALAARREVGTALATAHRQRSQGILEGLFKAQELQDGEVHGCVETNTALVGADGIVELNAVTQVGLYLTLVVYPRHTEGEDAIWFHQPFDNLCFFELGMLVVDSLDRQKDFFHCLQILGFTRMFCLQRGHNTFDIHNITLLKV